MSNPIPLRCSCGQVKGEARVSPPTGSHVVCYCDDCQAFARFLDRRDVLNARGGTSIFQMAPADVTLHEGEANLRAVRLSEKGLFRWFTACCRTPIGNTMGGRVPFVGLIDSFMVFADGRSRDTILGEPVGIMGKFAIGGPPEGVHPKFPPKLMPRTLRLLAGWFLFGRANPSPFFNASTHAPRVAPQVLAPDARRALRGAQA